MGSAEEPGIFRLKSTDNNESNPLTVLEAHTQTISGASKAYPTGETVKAMPKAAEGLIVNMVATKGRFVAYFVTDAADIVESEESACQIPINILNEKGQLIGKKVLTFENATGSAFDSGGTTDISCGAGVEQRIDYWEVPRGQLWQIDPQGKPHVYMGDDTA